MKQRKKASVSLFTAYVFFYLPVVGFFALLEFFFRIVSDGGE